MKDHSPVNTKTKKELLASFKKAFAEATTYFDVATQREEPLSYQLSETMKIFEETAKSLQKESTIETIDEGMDQARSELASAIATCNFYSHLKPGMINPDWQRENDSSIKAYQSLSKFSDTLQDTAFTFC